MCGHELKSIHGQRSSEDEPLPGLIKGRWQ